jgi:hypothetical protein
MCADVHAGPFFQKAIDHLSLARQETGEAGFAFGVTTGLGPVAKKLRSSEGIRFIWAKERKV